jgi:predicted enzyme related to lactoylglutathione lyase
MTLFAIDYFELPTTAMDGSQRFFRDAFGFGITPYGPGYSEITGGGVLGGLNAAEDGNVGPLIGIRTDDIAAAEAAIVAAGGVITRAVAAYPGGQRFMFREPGGCELLVYCPVE